MSLKGHNVGAVIKRLNLILRGWANYYKIGVSKKIFNSIDNWIYKRCVRYTKFTHPTKSREWRQSKYWGKLNPYREDRWVFGEKRTSNRYLYLLKLNCTPIERHVLVRGTASPDDPTLREYWINRKKRKINDLPTRQKYLARVQKGLCTQCRTSLFNEEELHVHHIHPKGTSGRDEWKNLRLLHYFCHQQVHRKKKWTEGA
jgi:RNA-directed DNA polymerase